jgi:hypothetical protein
MELKKLIYGSNDLVDRYNELRKNIAGFGVSTLSEILPTIRLSFLIVELRSNVIMQTT